VHPARDRAADDHHPAALKAPGLPRSIRAGLERSSKQDGTSIKQFVGIAVAEKLAMLQAETHFDPPPAPLQTAQRTARAATSSTSTCGAMPTR